MGVSTVKTNRDWDQEFLHSQDLVVEFYSLEFKNQDVFVETVEIETLDWDHVETNRDQQDLGLNLIFKWRLIKNNNNKLLQKPQREKRNRNCDSVKLLSTIIWFGFVLSLS